MCAGRGESKGLVRCAGDWCRGRHPCPLPTPAWRSRKSRELGFVWQNSWAVSGFVLTHPELGFCNRALLASCSSRFTSDRAELNRSEKHVGLHFSRLSQAFITVSFVILSSVPGPAFAASCCFVCHIYLVGWLVLRRFSENTILLQHKVPHAQKSHLREFAWRSLSVRSSQSKGKMSIGKHIWYIVMGKFK